MIIPQDHKDTMVAAYIAGDSLRKAAALFGYSKNICSDELKRRGIKRREGQKVIPQEHKDKMVSAYLAGNTLKEAAALFGYSRCACSNELKKRNILRRQRKDYGTSRKYAVDESFFDIINSEAKAYWLGFLSADGSIRKNAVQLGLAARDREHLVKFLAAIKSEHPIYEWVEESWGKEYPQAAVTIYSTKLSAALQVLGVIERKSLIIKPCQQVPKRLIHHYWRGCVDGDGWITRDKAKRHNSPYWIIGLAGSKEMVRGFDTWVKTVAKARAQPRPKGNIFSVHYGGTIIAKAIATNLYRNSHIWLNRKHEKALLAMSAEIKRQDRSDITLVNINAFRAKYGTWATISRATGIPESSLYGIRKRLLAQEQSNTAEGI